VSKRDLETLSNLEAEQLVLGAILCNNEMAYRVMDLEPQHFASSLHGDIFKSIRARMLRGESATMVTMKPEFMNQQADGYPDASQYIAALAGQSGNVFAIKDYAASIMEMWQRREMYAAMEKHLWRIATPRDGESVVEISNQIFSTCMEYGTKKKHQIRTGSQVTGNILAAMEKKLPCYSTGIPALDNALGGGIYAGMCYDFNAYMKGGKTTFLGSITGNMRHGGAKVAYICAEMGENQIHQRHIARMIGENSLSFYKKRSDPAFIEKVFRYAGEERKEETNQVLYLSIPGITFEELKRQCMTLIRRDKVNGIVLDYIQLVRGRERNESPIDHAEKVCEWIASMVKEEEIFFITAAQLNREGNIRGGDNIKMFFDWIGNINYDEERRMGWIDCTDSRYTMKMNVGSKDYPALKMHMNGVHFADINQADYDQGRMDL
jgi:replicative DNA helicase